MKKILIAALTLISCTIHANDKRQEGYNCKDARKIYSFLKNTLSQQTSLGGKKIIVGYLQRLVDDHKKEMETFACSGELESTD